MEAAGPPALAQLLRVGGAQADSGPVHDLHKARSRPRPQRTRYANRKVIENSTLVAPEVRGRERCTELRIADVALPVDLGTYARGLERPQLPSLRAETATRAVEDVDGADIVATARFADRQIIKIPAREATGRQRGAEQAGIRGTTSAFLRARLPSLVAARGEA